jgi:hypothetical protein
MVTIDIYMQICRSPKLLSGSVNGLRVQILKAHICSPTKSMQLNSTNNKDGHWGAVFWLVIECILHSLTKLLFQETPMTNCHWTYLLKWQTNSNSNLKTNYSSRTQRFSTQKSIALDWLAKEQLFKIIAWQTWKWNLTKAAWRNTDSSGKW